MKVFVTGASGFVGSAVVAELLANGHQVVGLARSDASAKAVAAAGAEVQRGSLDDLESLHSGAAAADAVIHTAFIHDFSDYAGAAAADKQAIAAMGEALVGTDRPFIVTAGTAGLAVGQLLTEDDAKNSGTGRVSEEAAMAFVDRGVRVSVMRLPPSVHGEGDHGFVPQLINIAREKGISGYPNEGANRWASVHRLDAARLYRLALETAHTGARLHAVADEGITSREIATVIGRHLNVPVQSVSGENIMPHFGWIGAFFSLDILASSAITQQRFGWHPTGSTLLADLEEGHYFTHTS